MESTEGRVLPQVFIFLILSYYLTIDLWELGVEERSSGKKEGLIGWFKDLYFYFHFFSFTT